MTTGVDIIEIERIERTIMRWSERFLQRVYTSDEIDYCRGRAQRFAGRFAAKEATSKALGVGIRVLRWKDIEVVPNRRGKPVVLLHGRAAAAAESCGLTRFEVSITHSRGDAIAFVVAYGEDA
ncbi:MAG: holo-[acyl-carrier-protein] synthase [Chloroflexi bacterium]|nr:MAG: holo-[acyl-carrier-protein] synthase [Chloroflexota bacterium]